jgi:hypothetical protein
MPRLHSGGRLMETYLQDEPSEFVEQLKHCCGRIIPGWTYVEYDPEVMNVYSNQKARLQSRCINGWIRRTVWRQAKGLVAEDGGPLWQPYHFTGKCRCQPGGTL